MLKVSRKHSKNLAKLVLVALLCIGGVHGIYGKSVAEASELTVTGMTWSNGPTFSPVPDSLIYGGPYAYIPNDQNVVILNLAAGENNEWQETIDIAGHYGGYNSESDVTGYTVNMTGSKVAVGTLWSGYAFAGNSADNHIKISDGSADFTIGGYSYKGDAIGNGVIIDGGTITGNGYYAIAVAGGSAEKGNANDNTVIIEGKANVNGNVYGGVSGNSNYGSSAGGKVTNNTVTISANAGDIGNAIGGQSSGGNATTNTLNVSGGLVKTAVGGVGRPVVLISGVPLLKPSIEKVDSNADTVLEGNAIDNTVNISGDAKVYMAMGGTTSSIFLQNGGGIPASVKGTGVANNNTVNISSGTFSFKETEERTGKTMNEGGIIIGGMSHSEASGNTVNISGGNFEAATIIGGISMPLPMYGGVDEYENPIILSPNVQGKADNNTVNILTPINAGALIGGMNYVASGNKMNVDFSKGSGNTLNVAAKNVSAFTVGGFQNINFFLPRDVANGDTMLTIKTPKTIYEMGKTIDFWLSNKYEYELTASGGVQIGDSDGNIILTPKPTDLTGVIFGVTAQQGVSLEVGNIINLVTDPNGLTTDDTLKTIAQSDMVAPKDITTDTKYGLIISKKNANTIIATVDSKRDDDNTDRAKSAAETRESVVSMVNTAADLLAGQGLSNASDAAGTAGGKMEPFAAVGVSNLRAESGSHVTTKGIGLALGFAKEIENRSGKLLIGPVLEYGHGKYDSYQDDGTKADGKSHYWGIGVIAKQTNNNGLYYEGSLRVGRVGSDYTRNEDANIPYYHADYDSKATYWGAHLGIGKVVDIGRKNTLDYYGKYFYSHTGSDSVTMHTSAFGDMTAIFDSVDSHRIRLGARVTHELNEKNKIYGGLAYQYEFNGDARVTYNNGNAVPSPSVKGSSGMLELGWQVKPGKSPMTIDLGVTGWVGKQRGVTANLQATWTF